MCILDTTIYSNTLTYICGIDQCIYSVVFSHKELTKLVLRQPDALFC